MATYEGTCGKYTIILNVSEVSSSVDVSSNTSKISWSLQFRADTAYCQWNPGPGDFEVKINGASVWSAQNPGLWFGGSGQTLTLASGTSGAITHNSDGAKTVSCQAIYIQNSTANYLPSSGSCSGNLVLSTIPRASSFSSITGNVIGENQTINIDRKSSNFTNNLWYRVGDEDWVSIGTEIDTSITWTLPTSLNNKIPNATSLTLTYLLRTYNGSTQIGGDVTYDFNVNYSGEKPTAGTATITYSKLFNNKFIANYSFGTISYSGYDGVYGSTVKSAQVVFNGSWKGTTNYSTGLLTAGTHTFQGVVTDSRENTSYTTQQSFTCYQINNPTVSINAYRSDSSGNANPSGTYITIIPTYSAHDPVGGNSIKSSSFTCTSLMTTGTAITSGSKKILSGAAAENQYVISGTVTDQLGRTSATSVQIGTAFALWDVRPDQRGMAFGKYSTGADKFEVAWDAYFDNSLNVTGNASFNNNSYHAIGITAKDVFYCGYEFSGASGTAEWVKLGTYYNTWDAASALITVMSGNGWNANSDQNTKIEIFVKDGHQSSASATGSFGVSYITSHNESFDIKVKALASTHNSVDIWVYFPWMYWNGYYTVQCRGAWTHSGTHQTSEPSGTEQNVEDKSLLNIVWPVGSIYISVNSTNPGDFLGGTWVEFGQGKTLVGVNTSETEFDTVEKTGGSKYLQKHTHYANTSWPYAQVNNGSKYGHTSGGSWVFGSVGNGVSVANTGSGDSENLQPYITVYFWKRTA